MRKCAKSRGVRKQKIHSYPDHPHAPCTNKRTDVTTVVTSIPYTDHCSGEEAGPADLLLEQLPLHVAQEGARLDGRGSLQALGRRAQIGAEAAADVHTLWQSHELVRFVEELTDVQRRKACQHFVQRIDALAKADYVPEPLDLLHMAIPTVGQQETRVPSFPGGELNVVELSVDASTAALEPKGTVSAPPSNSLHATL